MLICVFYYNEMEAIIETEKKHTVCLKIINYSILINDLLYTRIIIH